MSDLIPRLELAEMAPDLQAYLQPRVARLQYLGELFKCAAHAPEVLLDFMHFTDSLKKALPDRLTECAVLTTAMLMGNRYERHQHERLSVRLGFGRDWVAEVERLKPAEATLMSEVERAVQTYVMAAVETRGMQAASPFEALARLVPPAEAMAVAMLVGRYITHALVVNTLRLEPPVPSIWDDGFDGSSTSPQSAAPDAR